MERGRETESEREKDGWRKIRGRQRQTREETEKKRKRVNIPLSGVKPLGKQTNNASSTHKGVRQCKTTKCLSRLPTPYFVSPHRLHKQKQRPLKSAQLFEVEQ